MTSYRIVFFLGTQDTVLLTNWDVTISLQLTPYQNVLLTIPSLLAPNDVGGEFISEQHISVTFSDFEVYKWHTISL